MVKGLVIKSRALHEAKLFGGWQIVLLCLALLTVGTAAFLYVQIIRAESLEAEARDTILTNRKTLNALSKELERIKNEPEVNRPTVESVRQSLVEFEQKFLAPVETAQPAVVREVNRLARESGVDLSDINFDHIEQIFLEGESAQGVGQTGGDSLYPGLEMSFTMEGSYADIHQFLLALERSRTFLIINSLDLKSVEQSGLGRPSRGSRDAATNQVVAVGVKLSVYYQRELP